MCLASCCSVPRVRANGGRYTDELLVKQHDRDPLGPATANPLGMRGLDGRFELKAAATTVLGCFGKMCFRFCNQWQDPLLRVLLGERDVTAVSATARRSPSFAVEHEGQETSNLRFLGHEVEKDPREPDGLLGEVAAALIGTHHIVPSDPESGIDSFKYCLEPKV